MQSEWQDLRLGEVIRLQRGHDLPTQDRRAGNVPILGSFGITGMHDKAKTKGPGLTVGRSGASIGVVAYSEVDFWPLNTALYVTDFMGNYPRFCFYWLKTLNLASFDSGSAQPSLNRNYVYHLTVRVPYRLEQESIAAFLDALDNRINLLETTSGTLEATAQSLFKSWFVDFDPVRAKAEGREPKGMDAATAALFPYTLIEQQEVLPFGWESATLGSISEVGIGKTPPRGQSQWFTESSDDVVWVSIRDMGRSGLYISESSEYLTTRAIEKFNIRVVPDNTVILSFKLTVGRLAITSGPLTTNEAIAHLVLARDAAVSPEFLYCTLAAFNFHSLSSTSSIAEAVNSKTVRNIQVVVPDRPIVDAFTELVKPLFTSIKNNQEMARNIAELRDTLLPRLISGKLRVPEAEKLVGAVL